MPDSNTFHDDIAWLADAGVTLGCNPPANDQFCPDGVVTRAQMAAFMHRLAQYLDAEDGTPGFADTAADADKFDGLDSTDFVSASGGGTIVGAVRVQPNGALFNSWMANGNTPTVSHVAASGQYFVTFPGENVNINARAAFGNTLGASSGWMTLDSGGGDLFVYTFNTAGAATDDHFWAFITND